MSYSIYKRYYYLILDKKGIIIKVKKTFLPSLFLFFGLLIGALFFVQKASAATLASVSDTITTSRPSASTPLSANAASGLTQVSVYDNKSLFLASDSAKLFRTSTGAVIDASITVASQSAARTTVYFAEGTGAAGQNGTDVLMVPITAMHKVQFTIPNPIPASGKIVITFPGSADTSASPSATTFAFNGLTTANASTNIAVNGATCTWAIAAPALTCTVSSAVSATTTVTILIGCSAQSEGTCTTQVPRFINPTKTAAAGTADTWTLQLKTQDSGSIDIDTAKVKIGTVESVQVQATVDPTLTFVISSIADNTAINTGNATGCTNTENTSSGIGSTATTVDLGTLSTAINISAQLITITTNAINGYSLTATSSGHLINPATGFWIIDSITPAVFPSGGTPWFGIHPCGLDNIGGTWGTGATAKGSGAKYGWPTQTTSVTLAYDTTGPIGNTLTAGNGLVSVEYAALIDASVPAGLYTAVVTYVATPTF